MNTKSIVTIVTELHPHYFDSPTVTKAMDNQDCELTVVELDALITQLHWVLRDKASESAYNNIEVGKLYYHKKNHHYYLAIGDKNCLQFTETDNNGITKSSTVNASNMNLTYLRLVAKQPAILAK